MNKPNIEVIDTFGDFNYVYYSKRCGKIYDEYLRMWEQIAEAGHALSFLETGPENGILLEKDNKVIAGAFFDLKSYPSAVLIFILYVEPEYRNLGIWTKLHSLIDYIGKQNDKTGVYSYIHLKNTVMVEHAAKSIGYEPVMHLVRRSIK